MKIGVMLDSFRQNFADSVKKASELGIEGVQLWVTGGEICPENMDPARIRETLDILSSHHLELSALCCGGSELKDPGTNPADIEAIERALDLSVGLGCNIVTAHIGTVPEEECRVKEIMRGAMNEISDYADSIGAKFAVETGPEPGRILGCFLDSLDGHGIGINFDPANLVMCSDDRPENALRWLGKYVVHTHAKDGVMVSKKIAEARAEGRATPEYDALMAKGRTFLEVPLGEGDVDFDVYLPALAATGFDGFLAIEREVGEDPAKDIALAVNFLKEKLARCGIPH